MAFDLLRLQTRLDLLDWRDRQLEVTADQLEAAFPELTGAIDRCIAAMTTVAVWRAHLNPRPLAESLIAPWAEAQGRIAASRAESSLSELILSLSPDDGIGGHVRSALPAVAGVGMLAASFLGVPAVVSYATITTTSLLVFSTSTVSLPLLVAGGTVLAGLSFAGGKAVDKARDKMRAHLVARVQGLAMAAVFGHGRAADARCVLNDLQAAILRAGQTRPEGIA